MICQATDFTGSNEHDRRWPNWSGEVRFVATEWWEPAHSAEGVVDALPQLVNVIARASAEDQGVHAIGSGWAFEDAAASDAWIVATTKLDRQLDHVVGNGGAGLNDDWRTVQADPGSPNVLVHVEAGIRIASISELLDAQGLAMPTLGGSNGQSLAGAFSTSTHGGDWQQPPLPDLVKAIHLVTDGGQELWIERASERITQDDRLRAVLPCAGTEIIADDRVFESALVSCGRFGVIYSVVVEVRRAFRLVEVVSTPTRAEVVQALRDGVTSSTLLQPLFDLLAMTPSPAGLVDATGLPYFTQVLFNSQDPNDVWVHRRFETTDPNDLPAPDPLPPGGVHVTASPSDHDLAVNIVVAANAAFALAAATAGALTLGVGAVYIAGVQVHFNAMIGSRPFTLGSVVAAAVDAIWKVPAMGHVIPELNFMVLDGRFRSVITGGRRGPHHLITSGTRADSDSDSYRAASIELIFDATTSAYLDFLDEILPVAPRFQQAGYVSLRPSLASKALLSMHGVAGSHAISIEISSLQGLPGNAEWMSFVHRAAVARGGRPHWGQFNRLDALDTSMLYGSALNEWREGLLRVSGTSKRFSNNFTRTRGLEPEAIVREVTATRKPRGVTSHLCNSTADWSPVSVAQAIREIVSGTVQYFVRSDAGVVPITVVDGRYLRTRADASEANNLDSLPDC